MSGNKMKAVGAKITKLPELKIPYPADSDEEADTRDDQQGGMNASNANLITILTKLKAGKENMQQKRSPSKEDISDSSLSKFAKEMQAVRTAFKADTYDVERTLAQLSDYRTQLQSCIQQTETTRQGIVNSLTEHKKSFNAVEKALDT